MRVIARSEPAAIAAAVVAILLPALHADTHSDIMHVFGNMATALSGASADQFMESFDRNMPDYDRIKTEVTQLIAQGEISSTAQPVRDEGDNKHRSVDLDWSLEIKNPDPSQPSPLLRRRDVVHCRLERLNKHWRIVALDPLSFFAPENPDQK